MIKKKLLSAVFGSVSLAISWSSFAIAGQDFERVVLPDDDVSVSAVKGSLARVSGTAQIADPAAVSPILFDPENWNKIIPVTPTNPDPNPQPRKLPYNFLSKPTIIKPGDSTDAATDKNFDYYLLAFVLTVPKAKTSFQGITGILTTDSSDPTDLQITGICPTHLYAVLHKDSSLEESLSITSGMAPYISGTGSLKHIGDTKQDVSQAVLEGAFKILNDANGKPVNEFSFDFFKAGKQKIIAGDFTVYLKIQVPKNKKQTLTMTAARWDKEFKQDPQFGYVTEIAKNAPNAAVEHLPGIILDSSHAVSVNTFITAHDTEPNDVKDLLQNWAKNPDVYMKATDK